MSNIIKRHGVNFDDLFISQCIKYLSGCPIADRSIDGLSDGSKFRRSSWNGHAIATSLAAHWEGGAH